MKEIGERIAQRRLDLSISQEALAELVGSTQRQISKYENGINKPTSEVLSKIADALQASADWLLGRTEIIDRPMRGQGDLTEDEIEILGLIRRNPEKRKAIYNVIKEIAQV